MWKETNDIDCQQDSAHSSRAVLVCPECIAFGAGYFAKVPVSKALTELGQIPGTGSTGTSGQVGTPQVGTPQVGGAYGAIG